eukprot:gene14248-20221_t
MPADPGEKVSEHKHEHVRVRAASRVLTLLTRIRKKRSVESSISQPNCGSQLRSSGLMQQQHHNSTPERQHVGSMPTRQMPEASGPASRDPSLKTAMQFHTTAQTASGQDGALEYLQFMNVAVPAWGQQKGAGRTDEQPGDHSRQKAENNSLKQTTAWTPQEDKLLRSLVAQYGEKKWSTIAGFIKTKGGKQCCRRYKNSLSSSVKKGGWASAEDAILLAAHQKLGNKWTEIANLVGRRSDNAAKNRYNTLCKRIVSGADLKSAMGKEEPPAKAADSDDDEEDEEEDEPPMSGSCPEWGTPVNAASANLNKLHVTQISDLSMMVPRGSMEIGIHLNPSVSMGSEQQKSGATPSTEQGKTWADDSRGSSCEVSRQSSFISRQNSFSSGFNSDLDRSNSAPTVPSPLHMGAQLKMDRPRSLLSQGLPPKPMPRTQSSNSALLPAFILPAGMTSCGSLPSFAPPVQPAGMDTQSSGALPSPHGSSLLSEQARGWQRSSVRLQPSDHNTAYAGPGSGGAGAVENGHGQGSKRASEDGSINLEERRSKRRASFSGPPSQDASAPHTPRILDLQAGPENAYLNSQLMMEEDAVDCRSVHVSKDLAVDGGSFHYTTSDPRTSSNLAQDPAITPVNGGTVHSSTRHFSEGAAALPATKHRVDGGSIHCTTSDPRTSSNLAQDPAINPVYGGTIHSSTRQCFEGVAAPPATKHRVDSGSIHGTACDPRTSSNLAQDPPNTHLYGGTIHSSTRQCFEGVAALPATKNRVDGGSIHGIASDPCTSSNLVPNPAIVPFFGGADLSSTRHYSVEGAALPAKQHRVLLSISKHGITSHPRTSSSPAQDPAITPVYGGTVHSSTRHYSEERAAPPATQHRVDGSSIHGTTRNPHTSSNLDQDPAITPVYGGTVHSSTRHYSEERAAPPATQHRVDGGSIHGTTRNPHTSSNLDQDPTITPVYGGTVHSSTRHYSEERAAPPAQHRVDGGSIRNTASDLYTWSNLAQYPAANIPFHGGTDQLSTRHYSEGVAPPPATRHRVDGGPVYTLAPTPGPLDGVAIHSTTRDSPADTSGFPVDRYGSPPATVDPLFSGHMGHAYTHDGCAVREASDPAATVDPLYSERMGHASAHEGCAVREASDPAATVDPLYSERMGHAYTHDGCAVREASDPAGTEDPFYSDRMGHAYAHDGCAVNEAGDHASPTPAILRCPLTAKWKNQLGNEQKNRGTVVNLASWRDT